VKISFTKTYFQLSEIGAAMASRQKPRQQRRSWEKIQRNSTSISSSFRPYVNFQVAIIHGARDMDISLSYIIWAVFSCHNFHCNCHCWLSAHLFCGDMMVMW